MCCKESVGVMRNTKLIEMRTKKGLTQIQLAEKAGISEVSYQRMEYGTQIPRLDTAFRIARAVGSTVDNLFSSIIP